VGVGAEPLQPRQNQLAVVVRVRAHPAGDTCGDRHRVSAVDPLGDRKLCPGARQLLPEACEPLDRRRRPDGPGQGAERVAYVERQRLEGALVVDLGEHKIVWRRSQRRRDDCAVRGNGGEVGVGPVRPRVVSQPCAQPEEKVVLGLARDEKVVDPRTKAPDVEVPLDLHGQWLAAAQGRRRG
jgi:hypothetical protein